MPEPGYTKRYHVWDRDQILDKAREWAELYGEPPRSQDWHPTDCMAAAKRSADRASRWVARAARYHSGEWPWVGTVRRHFGGWNNMLREAGLPVRWASKAPPALPSRTTVDELQQILNGAKRAKGVGRVTELLRLAEAALTAIDGEEEPEKPELRAVS